MSEYRQCECPYHDDGDGFIGGGNCPNEGRINPAKEYRIEDGNVLDLFQKGLCDDLVERNSISSGLEPLLPPNDCERPDDATPGYGRQDIYTLQPAQLGQPLQHA